MKNKKIINEFKKTLIASILAFPLVLGFVYAVILITAYIGS